MGKPSTNNKMYRPRWVATPTGSRAQRRSLTAIMTGLVVMTFAACGGSGSSTSASGTAGSSEAEASDSSQDSTTTTTVEDALDDALRIAVDDFDVADGERGQSLTLTFRQSNRDDRPIAAFQTLVVVTAVDTLGREYTADLLHDCSTRAPDLEGQEVSASTYGPGPPVQPWGEARMYVEELNGGPDPDALSAHLAEMQASALAIASDQDACVRAAWDAATLGDAGTLEALEADPAPTFDVELTRVVFADGDGIGEAQ